jgi:hypothetical protein
MELEGRPGRSGFASVSGADKEAASRDDSRRLSGSILESDVFE